MGDEVTGAAATGGMPERLRSVLYVPGANGRALEKAAGLGADALILDLEDAVAPAAKEEARERVATLVRSGGLGAATVVIRINGIDTGWYQDDLRAAAEVAPAAVLVPKVASAAHVVEVEEELIAAGAPASVRLWAMLETPRAVLSAAELADATERLSVLVMGTNDLAAELRVDAGRSRDELLYGLSGCVIAARAAGRLILDGVYNDVRDHAGFEAECRQARRLGFDGKTLIHPGQVAICNRTFSPSPDEVAWASRVIEAFSEAELAGKGVATVDGRLIESLHVANARRVLALATESSEDEQRA